MASLARRVWREERALALTAVLHALFVAAFLALDIVDDRALLGEGVWVKPLNFAASISIYSATIALLLLPLRLGRGRTYVRWASALPLGFEMLAIALQAARGVRSHFNDATPFDATLFALMGVAILVATSGAATLLVLHGRTRAYSPAVTWGVRAGLAVSLVGSAIGGAMSAYGAHTVGAPDGGAGGVAVTGWSTQHGDLRVSHFAGLHALQVLPLAALAWEARASPRAAVRGTLAIAALYGAFVVGLFAWAALGHPF